MWFIAMLEELELNLKMCYTELWVVLKESFILILIINPLITYISIYNEDLKKSEIF